MGKLNIIDNYTQECAGSSLLDGPWEMKSIPKSSAYHTTVGSMETPTLFYEINMQLIYVEDLMLLNVLRPQFCTLTLGGGGIYPPWFTNHQD